MLVLLPLFFEYSWLPLDEWYTNLRDVAAQSELAALAVIAFLHAASEGFLDTLKRDSFIDSRVLHFVAISSLLISYVEAVGVCAILDGSGYNIATAVIACKVMRSPDWLAVLPKPVSQRLTLSMRFGSVSVFTIKAATLLLWDGKKFLLTQPLLFAVLRLRNALSWA